MREYGQVQCAFWERASEEQWSSDAMLLAAYLMTGPKSNGIGCYRLTDGAVMDDLRWTRERVEQTFSELFGKGFCNRFGTVVLMPKFLRWNAISNGNVAKARAQEFEAIPNDEAKTAAALALLTFGNHWEKGFINRLETLSKGYAKQERTQPNPTHIESPDGDLSPAAPDDDSPEADDDVNPVPGKPACPHKAIIAAYHEILPELRQVRDWNETRARLLSRRWAESQERQNLPWWQEYFRYVRTSKFLMGKTIGRDGRPFDCDLEWLVRPTNFAKVIEGKYEERAA